MTHKQIHQLTLGVPTFKKTNSLILPWCKSISNHSADMLSGHKMQGKEYSRSESTNSFIFTPDLRIPWLFFEWEKGNVFSRFFPWGDPKNTNKRDAMETLFVAILASFTLHLLKWFYRSKNESNKKGVYLQRNHTSTNSTMKIFFFNEIWPIPNPLYLLIWKIGDNVALRFFDWVVNVF